MQIIFAGTTIAKESPEGGTDSVQGFTKPSGQRVLKWRRPVRAKVSRPVSRDNEETYESGTILFSQEDTLEDGIIARTITIRNLFRLGNGPLILRTAKGGMIYPFAVWESFKILENSNGVAVGFTARFGVGEAQELDLALVTGTGLGIVTGDGKQIVI